MAAPMNHADAKDNPQTYPNSGKTNTADDDWMYFYVEHIRDCSYYKEESHDCKSWRGRLYQRYVYGDSLDCTHWKDMYNYCEKFKATKDKNAQENLVQFEKARNKYRSDNARANDVWEYRTEPPDNWNDPLKLVKRESIKTDNDNLPDSKSAGDNHETPVKTNETSNDIQKTQGEQKKSELASALSKGSDSTAPVVPGKKSGWCNVS